MNHQLLSAELLAGYMAIKANNPRFSKRAYAKKLGMSHGPLIEIMNGKRSVSPKLAEKICQKLCLSPKQTKIIVKKIALKNNLNNQGPVDLKSELEYELKEDQFNLIADPIYFAFLNLITLKNESHDLSHLAKRLYLTEEQTKIIIKRLFRLSLIKINKQNRYERTHETLKTTDEVLNLAIRSNQKMQLEKSIQILNGNTPIEKRDFSTITMAINSKKIAAAKKMIRIFQDELALFLEDQKADEVYTFCTQFIPQTRLGETK